MAQYFILRISLKEMSEAENQQKEDSRSLEVDDAKSEEAITLEISEMEVTKPAVLTERLENQLDSTCKWFEFF